MSDDINKDPMLEMYLFESNKLIAELEEMILEIEKGASIEEYMEAIFRIMHTIKGNSNMMLFENLAEVSHSVEDLFFYLREEKPKNYNIDAIIDIVLKSVDFIKNEMEKLEAGEKADAESKYIKSDIDDFLGSLKFVNPETKDKKVEEGSSKFYISADKDVEDNVKNEDLKKYSTILFFEEDCEMENVRAFGVAHNLKDLAENITYEPSDIIENEESIKILKTEGFLIKFESNKKIEDLKLFFDTRPFVQRFTLEEVIEKEEQIAENSEDVENKKIDKKIKKPSNKAKFISVSVDKLDKLMDFMGELVVSEAMVSQNPDVKDLDLENFNKAVRQHRKIIKDLQDIVMSIRMVPLSMTFNKMNRLVRDVSKKLNKEIELKIIGENTEVDKNIIERISDPLVHIIRNSIDHGIEGTRDRENKGKNKRGTIVLEAKNSGSDVWIIIKDDGKGLDKDKILKKALQNNILEKPIDEYTDKEAYSLIFNSGLSTKDKVTDLSGRGVGMDIVKNNIDEVGGSIHVDSQKDKGTEIALKIPLTLAIIDGMTIKVGNSHFTIPITSIKESFSVESKNIIEDEYEREMILIRGECHRLIRLHEIYNIDTKCKEFEDGIVIMVENDNDKICLFADSIEGEQQVVLKNMSKFLKKVQGVSGCALLGDGKISLVVDPDEFIG
ncbi:MAG: chemotaxis protein CheA [Peptostreptococcaceae bacterium]|nr:chemotaxis protein CheA [Peptostreptococcaceae bacterium]